jgi:hypothetical protein
MNSITVRKSRKNINPWMLEIPEAVVYVVREIARRDTDTDNVRAVVAYEGEHLGGIGAVRELRSETRTLGQYQILGKRHVDGDAIFGFVSNTRIPTWEV